MSDIENEELRLYDQTGALLILDKKERKLVKLLLSQFMGTEKGRDYIAKNLDQEYIKIAGKLLEALGAPETSLPETV